MATSEAQRRAVRKYLAKNRDKMKAAQKRYNAKNKHKISANNKLRWAVKHGRIEKLPCTVCGSENSEAHHEDYGKPLDVIWLCRKHHKEIHRKHDPLILA